MENRIYLAPTTKDILSAIELIFSINPKCLFQGKNYPYTTDFSLECFFFNGTDNKRYLISGNHQVYCSGFILDEQLFRFGSTLDPFCKGVNLDEILEKYFQKSKNNKKKTYLILNEFNTNPNVKSAKNLLGLYNLSFEFGSSGSWMNTHIIKPSNITIAESKPVKTAKNKLKDELSAMIKEIRKKESEINKLKEMVLFKMQEIENA
jgi:hypothetical protein